MFTVNLTKIIEELKVDNESKYEIRHTAQNIREGNILRIEILKIDANELKYAIKTRQVQSH